MLTLNGNYIHSMFAKLAIFDEFLTWYQMKKCFDFKNPILPKPCDKSRIKTLYLNDSKIL